MLFQDSLNPEGLHCKDVFLLSASIPVDEGISGGGSQNNSKGRIAREAKGMDVGDGDGGSLLDALIDALCTKEQTYINHGVSF